MNMNYPECKLYEIRIAHSPDCEEYELHGVKIAWFI